MAFVKLPPEIARRSDAELVEMLDDPDLDLDLRERILDARPDIAATYADGWSLRADGHGSGIVGPDGRWYPILPSECTDEQGNMLPAQDRNWTTVGDAATGVTYGRQLPFGALMLANGIGGGGIGAPTDEWHSVGTDQLDYVRTDGDGLRLDVDVAVGSDYQRPPGGPTESNRVTRYSDALDIAFNAADGLTYEQQTRPTGRTSPMRRSRSTRTATAGSSSPSSRCRATGSPSASLVFPAPSTRTARSSPSGRRRTNAPSSSEPRRRGIHTERSDGFWSARVLCRLGWAIT
ncbi:MAG: hypothetical protein ACRDO7_16520 [Nocardioidaceae bacterium]